MKLFARLRLYTLALAYRRDLARIASALERLAAAAEREHPPRKVGRPEAVVIESFDQVEANRRWRAEQDESMLADDEDEGTRARV